MSASLREWCVAVVATVVLAATVAPWVATTAAAQPTASFEQRVVSEQTGDVANVTVTAGAPATVTIGSRDDAFLLRVKVGKGTTKLRLNTYKAGASNRYSPAEMVWAAKGNVRSRTLVTDPIEAPLDPAQYSMNVTIGGVEHDLATLWVTERTTEGITARIAPRSTAVSELSSGADVTAASVSPWNGSVARDDWLLLHVNASGVKGLLGVRNSPDESLLDGDAMRVAFEQTNPPMNGPGNEFAGDDVRRVFTHPASEGFHLAVDTGDHDVDPGDRYRVSFVVPEDSPLADAREEVSTEIRVVERRVTLNRNGPDRTIVVDGESTISGRTTLTPGSTINITARDPGVAPLFEHREVEVGDDRRFAATFDFSGYERGREFEFLLRDLDPEKTVPAVVEGVVTTTEETTEPETTTRPPTTTVPPTTPPPTTTTAPPPTTPPPNTTAVPTTRPPTTATATADGLTQRAMDSSGGELTQQAVRGGTTQGNDGPVPGFGPVAVVAALVVGLALAVRRT